MIGAKKRVVAIEAISTLLDTCRDYNVDLIGCDMNQGVALRKTHTTSPLLEAMTSFCQKHGIGVENADFRELLAQAPGDCCGFIIMPSSSMFTDFIVVKHGWAPFCPLTLACAEQTRTHIIPVICSCAARTTRAHTSAVMRRGPKWQPERRRRGQSCVQRRKLA